MAKDGINKEVKTTFTVSDKASAKTKRIGNNMREAGGQIGRTTGMLGPLMAGLGALSAFVSARSILKLGDQFEQTNLQIAGFLTALGFTKDYNQGLQVAAATMERIRISAALLPGSAQDYITVFKAGLPVMAKAVEGNLGNMIKFSNKYAAITKSLGIDSAQAGRDLALMLRGGRGGAGADVRSFMTLAPFIRKLKGQADMTTDSFNKMTSPERAKVLKKTFESFGPMLKKASGTFDAMWGAAKSNAQLLIRLGTKPLFEGAKKALGFMNESISKSDGQLTPLGEKIVLITNMLSQGFLLALKMVSAQAKEVYGWFEKVGKTVGFATVKADLLDIAGTIGGALSKGTAKGATAGTAGGGGFGAAAGIGALALGASGPLGILIAAFASFATRTEALALVIGEITALGAVLAPVLGAVIEGAMVVSAMLGDVLEGALGGLIMGIRLIVKPIADLLVGMLQLSMVIFTKLRPALMFLWEAVGELFVSIGQFLGPILQIFGTGLLIVYDIFMTKFAPILNIVVKALGYLVKGISAVLSVLGKGIKVVADGLDKTVAAGKEAPKPAPKVDFLSGFFASLKTPGKKGSLFDFSSITAPKTPTTPTAPKVRGGGGRTVQDFRYSRFSIEQKFAEGMDPDRIAVAFAQDVGKIAEQRLQSGFEPLFSIQ